MAATTWVIWLCACQTVVGVWACHLLLLFEKSYLCCRLCQMCVNSHNKNTMTHPLWVAKKCTTHPLPRVQKLMTHPLSAPAHTPPIRFDQSLKSAIFAAQFMTWPKIRYPIYTRCVWHSCPKHKNWRAFANGLINNDENVVSSKKHTQFKTECKKHTLFETKMAKIDTLSMTKTSEKPYPLGPHIPI